MLGFISQPDPAPMFSPSRFALVLMASLAIVACSRVGKPKISLEDLRNYYGANTSLIESAVEMGNLEHVEALIYYGISEIELKDSLISFIGQNNYQGVKLILSQEKLSGDDYYNSLGYTVYSADIEVLKPIIDYGKRFSDSVLDEKVWGENEYTLLMLAIEKDRPIEIINELIRVGADVNYIAANQQMPLTLAISKSRNDLFSLLLENGASINYLESDALHTVVRNDNIDIAKILISNGFDVNKKDGYNYTPLRIAVDNSNIEIVRLLIAAGADVNIGNKYGYTPFAFALNKDKNFNIEIVKELIIAGIDANAPINNENDTALHYLSTSNKPGRIELAKILIEAGADVNKTTRWGWDGSAEWKGHGNTPLHLISRSMCWSNADIEGNIEIAKMLITAGADINKKNDDGYTPLYYLSRNCDSDRELIELLIKMGAA